MVGKLLDDIYRRIVFFVGDIRKIHSFPWITWDVHQHKVRLEEIMEALPLIRYGDIGIHRDEGYCSNLAIPGFMKHAWIHTEDGQNPLIIEAVSEGVIKRSAVYPMYSDYTIILRPKDVDEDSRAGACLKAEKIVGTRYDHHFEFDIEEELEFYKGQDIDKAAEDLDSGKRWIRKYDHGFSCTEVVSFSYWHEREKLRIWRTKRRGKNVILADTFLNGGWDIVWASESVTVDIAAKLKLHEEGIEMIRTYRS